MTMDQNTLTVWLAGFAILSTIVGTIVTPLVAARIARTTAERQEKAAALALAQHAAAAALVVEQQRQAAAIVAADVALMKTDVTQVTTTLETVAKAVDGQTKELIRVTSKAVAAEATAAEKVAQGDRETQQAKGAAAARQADAGAKVTTPLAMASPSPEPPKVEKP